MRRGVALAGLSLMSSAWRGTGDRLSLGVDQDDLDVKDAGA